MAEYVYPNCVSTVLYNGGRVRLHPTQQWKSDDPFVKARPEFFSETPLVAAHSDGYTVEQATAAPGEKRTVRRPRGQAAKTPKAGAPATEADE
jgi:hypothetical protein